MDTNDEEVQKLDRSIYRLHPQVRAKERYGVTLSIHDLNEMTELIKKGRAKWRGIDYPYASIWCVRYKDIDFIAVYNGVWKRIATFLPNKKRDRELAAS